MRIIREVEPPKPSTRLSSLSVQELSELGGRRQEEPRRLGRLVQGDLDWIVMKALEKDRKRRYETATSLAQDLQRHLSNEPVVARPPSTVYVLQKLVRRHRVAFVAASAAISALLLGLSLSTYLFFREKAALNVAEAATQKAEQANARTLQALQATQAAKALTEMALKQSEAAEADAKHQREVAIAEQQRKVKAETRIAELETEIDRQRRYVMGIADAFGEQQAALEKLQLPDDEKLSRALVAVAEREKLPEADYWAAINRFIAAVRANPKADFRDRALADLRKGSLSRQSRPGWRPRYPPTARSCWAAR